MVRVRRAILISSPGYLLRKMRIVRDLVVYLNRLVA
jgi:hypothetical protein